MTDTSNAPVTVVPYDIGDDELCRLTSPAITPQQAAKVLLEAYPQAHPDLGTVPNSPFVGPIRKFIRAIAEQEKS